MRLCPKVSFVALLSLSSFFACAGAYDVDANSCTDGWLDYVKRAVNEARLMAEAGKDAILAESDGDSIKELWHTKDISKLKRVQRYLQDVVDFPDLFDYKPGSAPLFFCVGNTFVKQPDASFLDPNSGTAIKPQGDIGLDTLIKGAQATTYQSVRSKLPKNPRDLHSVILLRRQILPGLLPLGLGGSLDSAGTVATLADIINQQNPPAVPRHDEHPDEPVGRKGLYHGKSVNRIVGYWLTSAVILHEYMHVVFPKMISHGGDERYGWTLCAGRRSKLKKDKPRVKNYDQAIVNADNYMHYCLSAHIEATTDYKVVTGQLFLPPSEPSDSSHTIMVRSHRAPFQFEA